MLRSIYSPPRYTPAKVALQKSRVRQSIYRSGYKYADKRIDRVLLGVPTNAFRSELGLPPPIK
jgi:hypothetical protein